MKRCAAFLAPKAKAFKVRTVLLALLLSMAAFGVAGTPQRPNFIFILADDLGYGDLGCYGGKNIETPRLDRMAAEGMRFTQHYAGSTVCAPSRACLLTGQHTGHVYQRANGDIEFREDPLDHCIARDFRTAGYTTALIGKSGLSCHSLDGLLPNRKGFDHFFGFIDHRSAHRHYPPSLWRNGKEINYPGNHGKEGDVYSGELFIEDALRFLDANRERPFFLHLALQQPHLGLHVPPGWRERYEGRFDESIPFHPGHYRGEKRPNATYAGMVSHLDHGIGRLLDKLEELGLAKNTLVLFASDNGHEDSGKWRNASFDSNGPLRGGKRDLYEGGIRVPMIAWWPGVVAAGGESDHVSAFWDFAPTACELAGFTMPSPLDGISYAPTLLGEGAQAEHDDLYWEFYERKGKAALRWGDWKGVRLNVNTANPSPLELYDLTVDLGEENNVAERRPEIVREIERRMAANHEPTERFRLGPKSKQPKK